MVSTTLDSSQQEFLAQLLDDGHPLPKGWNARHAAGMAIYRNAYRDRLVDALRDTYACTARWVGEDAFQQGAAHHVITHPPKSWTLDDVGEAFPDTLRELFAGDPEVAELGWLEWALHRCFVAADADPINAAGFSAATASFEEEDWSTMRLTFLPGTFQAPISHDIATLWKALKQEDLASPDYSANTPLSCVVWREQLKPVFIQVDATEGQALAMLLGGASYGEACNALIALLGEEAAASQAGAMLGRWLHRGMIAGVSK
jgi:hypothetical protein